MVAMWPCRLPKPHIRPQHLVVFALCLVTMATTTTSSARHTDGEAWWLPIFTKERVLRCNKIVFDDVTIVQHFTIDRLQVLQAQCKQWNGGIAAAVYVGLFDGTVQATSDWNGKTLEDALNYVQTLYEGVVADGCKADLVVFSETLPNISDWYTYPANAMRNMALDVAHTERFGMLLHDAADRAVYLALRKLLTERRRVLVIPAFNSSAELHDTSALHILNGDKQALAKAIEADHVAQFQAVFHRDTNYTQWWEAEQPYPIEFGAAGKVYKMPGEYEPYVLALKSQMPSYDERFRGYGYNKLSYFYYLHTLGFDFHVHPWAFVVHLHHEEQPRMREQLKYSNEKYRMMEKIFMREMPAQIRKGKYQPVLARQPFALGPRTVYYLG